MDCDGGLAQWQQKTCRSLRLGEINSLTFQAKYHEEVLELERSSAAYLLRWTAVPVAMGMRREIRDDDNYQP